MAFGRGELQLYAFSNFDSLISLSLLDIIGNSIWQYSIIGGDIIEGNLI
jgi:hypothetical protein